MASLDLSTIAQLLYADFEALDFARIVSELDTVLLRMPGRDVDIIWDCDDLVTFDLPETRILLSWSETQKRGVSGCLTVAVGPNPLAKGPNRRTDHDVLCSRLVERIQQRFAPASVLWHQVEGAVDSEMVDDLVDALPNVGAGNLPAIDTILDMLSQADQHLADKKANASHPLSYVVPELTRLATEPGNLDNVEPSNSVIDMFTSRPIATHERMIVVPQSMMKANPFPEFDDPANDRPDLPQAKSVELERLRTALEADPKAKGDGAAYSTQMRLAAHCLNATLILVYAPLGAAVMTYSVLRGENMQLSSRLMAVAGTLFALAHSPVGETMAVMAKSLG